jgi:regulator of telomere elongation helicase 1
MNERDRTLGFWCFNPGLVFNDMKDLGIRTIILTSGTLAPLNSFSAELGLSFEHRLENPHVISADQV